MDHDDQQPLVSTNIQEIEMQERSVARESTSHPLIDVEVLERIRINGTQLKKISPSMCIFEVPKCLRNLNNDLYAPEVVGLGPYHHTTTLPRFKKLKEEVVLRTLLKTYRDDPLGVALENLRNEVMQMKEDIQNCYDITFPFDPDMFILDSCFLLQFLFPCPQTFDYPRGFDWNVRNEASTYDQIKRDLMKLENQIPLILLQRLLRFQGAPDNDFTVFLMADCLFSHCFFDVSTTDTLGVLRSTQKTPGHLLEYGQQFVSPFVRDADKLPMNSEEEGVLNKCWRWFNTDSRRDNTEPMNAQTWSFRCAHELEKAGIELKCGRTLSFEEKWYGLKGVLTIPALEISDNSQVGIKNMIAFEESIPFNDRLMTGFTAILDNLIDGCADVEVLRRAGIIHSLLESDQAVADLINSTGINVANYPFPGSLRERMKVYCKSSWRVAIKEFTDSHISKPWVLIGTLAAFFLLVLTIVQTVYTVKSYQKGS